MTFAYAACFYPEEEGYSVIVPDFDAATQGDDIKEAIYMAEDLIAGLILRREKLSSTQHTLQRYAGTGRVWRWRFCIRCFGRSEQKRKRVQGTKPGCKKDFNNTVLGK